MTGTKTPRAEERAARPPRMAARVPGATYRLQLNAGFTLSDACGLLDYLDALGITDVYASPILAAQPGSAHGYDVLDHSTINPELGGAEAFARLASGLRARGMGLLLDVVPNHMAVGPGNRWWIDVLENGTSSRFAGRFDIDWDPPKPDLAGKVLIPILGDAYGRILENRELQVEFRNGAFTLRYHQTVLPLAVESWGRALEPALAALSGDDAAAARMKDILAATRRAPARTETSAAASRERERVKDAARTDLAALTEASPAARHAIEDALRAVNGRAGDARSFDTLDAWLSDQAYRLAYWRVASDEINYRRFFDINEYAALRVEDPDVFAAVHETVFRLVHEGAVTGLRIDHVDGLYDPAGYLEAIQRGAADAGAFAERPSIAPRGEPAHAGPAYADGASEPRPLYVVVEKILADDERLPDAWPIDGTTGYDALNLVGGVFVDPAGARRLHRAYARFTSKRASFADVAYACKKLVLRHGMSSQVAMLARRLDRISEQHRVSRDFTFQSLQDAFVEVMACFPVYRTYMGPDGTLSDEDRGWVERAVAEAKRRNPVVSESVFEFLSEVLTGDDPDGLTEAQIETRRDFVRRLQQVTGAVMAKAVEDTAFYRYYPLASRGEVGGTPGRPGVTVAQFHRGNRERLASHPDSMFATSTHDTKRGEDVRARIRVLSEMPAAWEAALARFREINRRHKRRVGGEVAPDANEEYLLYQTLLGTWPFDTVPPDGHAEFVARIQAYMMKMLCEAEIHTSWTNRNSDWEAAVSAFTERILTPDPDNPFPAVMSEIARTAARAGAYGSLAQVLLKATCPGVPDFYQGTELWDLSLVDPDNRRPVDFARRRQALAAVHAGGEDRPALVKRLLETLDDGRIKLYVTACALDRRRERHPVFARGEYVPLRAVGPHARHVLAFARTLGEHSLVVVVGRLLLALGAAKHAPVGGSVWDDTSLVLESRLATRTFRDAFTGLSHYPVLRDRRGQLPLAEVFGHLPLALLEADV